jgi:23S rRNA (uridine2552-2'-O)-methyltransferase
VAYERKDSVYRKAKREGFRSRAAYKLTELDRRFRILKRGQRVVDLGCWPGAWLQVVADRVGPTGRVVGVDRVETQPVGGENVQILQADIADEGVVAAVQTALGARADVVLSDLAPKLIGVRSADAARQAELIRRAMACACLWLRPDGVFLAKVFMNEEYPSLLAELRRSFRTVKATRAESTRGGSAELYVHALGPRGPATEEQLGSGKE